MRLRTLHRRAQRRRQNEIKNARFGRFLGRVQHSVFEYLGDGWFKHGDVVSNLDGSIVTTVDLAEFRGEQK